MSIHKRFSAEELGRIKAAVHKAEEKISGEIVPVFVEKSGFYSIANYRAAAVVASLKFLGIIIIDRYFPKFANEFYIYDHDLVFIFLIVALAGLVGFLLSSYIPAFQKLFVSQKHLDSSTRQRAETAFLQEEVFNTRHRTGILIFISFYEREVIVLADKGISKVVEQKEWDKLVRVIIENIRLGKVTDGMEAAILRCGEILLEKGFVKSDDDVNELGDDLRIE